MSSPVVGRFAPTTSGPAHPGTLLAALLCWLDARSRGGRVVLRLEDLDPSRCRPEYAETLLAALDWLGLDWDQREKQSDATERHAQQLDALAERGRLYPCACSRQTLRAVGTRARDGSFRYPGTCRSRSLPVGGWRAVTEALRVRLPEGRVEIEDAGGDDLGADPVADTGDPVVRRRDGAMAYHLASVVDDAAAGVTDVVRGRDLAPSTAVQVALQRLLDLPTPRYRHHLLLLEARDQKLAKFHGSVGWPVLREIYSGPELCGLLAHAAGLTEEPAPVRPESLLADFDWANVRTQDRPLLWRSQRLDLG